MNYWEILARDDRLKVKGLSTPITTPHYPDLAAWRKRADEIREMVKWSVGPSPRPWQSEVNARELSRVERDGFRILNVAVEAFEGFYVTANLYAPEGDGPFPAILNPHGHWPHGRLEDSATASVPARCINFALRGYVALSYDMVGYVDSQQVGHRFAVSDFRAALRSVSLCGLQVQAGIACLDYLSSLPLVDASRIGCTGASGGGSQTILLAALDDRIRSAVPVNMVSATCQGWCLCENPPGLRVETNNLEICALVAPRPLLLVSASGDWTSNTPDVEFPALARIYDLYGARTHIANVHLDAPHNYNMESRQAVYRWFDRWFGIEGNEDEEYLEIPFPTGDTKELRVDLTSEGLPGKKEVAAKLFEVSEDDAQRTVRGDVEQLRRGMTRCFGARPAEIPLVMTTKVEELNGTATELLMLHRQAGQEVFPLRKVGAEKQARGASVIYSAAASRVALKRHAEFVRACLDDRLLVVFVDAFLNDAWRSPNGQMGRDQRKSFFSTYNRTDPAERVRDIVSALTYLSRKLELPIKLLAGLSGGGLAALFAAALVPEVEAVSVDARDIPESLEAAGPSFFVPGLERAGGLGGALRLIFPKKLALLEVPPDWTMKTVIDELYADYQEAVTYESG